MDKKIYKGIVMRMSYGESIYSRKKALLEYLETENNQEFKANENKGILLFEMAKAYDEAIYEEFPEFKIFTDQTRKVVEIRTKLNLGIDLKISDIFKTNQYYNIDRATMYSFRTFSGKKKELQCTFQKIRRATLPNFIHHIDSLLVHLVITEFRKELKPIFTIHDAFYVRLIDMSFLKEAYFKALQKIHDLDSWSKFLETNQINLEDPQNDRLTEKEKSLAMDFNDMTSNWMLTR